MRVQRKEKKYRHRGGRRRGPMLGGSLKNNRSGHIRRFEGGGGVDVGGRNTGRDLKVRGST